ncbi:hypothetical protein mRhiFer1_008034 [Rhinolophus ferrumequinum]|uniref:Uncharacterized protein n=1 Tax=Rhinolophus ferrumequinum TaxID=59479 RepID=A0A7J7WQR3_RHIFE|nr:hypothetical protein mRhiFer1_008034 [Rhinolophus ferrumequinum]
MAALVSCRPLMLAAHGSPQQPTAAHSSPQQLMLAAGHSRWPLAAHGTPRQHTAARRSPAPGRAIFHSLSYRGHSSLAHVGFKLATSMLGVQHSNHLSHGHCPIYLFKIVFCFLWVNILLIQLN